MHATAGASDHVVTLYQRGASSTKVDFVIAEHCESTLRSRVDSDVSYGITRGLDLDTEEVV